jgi:membrane-bound lytic murein transglycosylase B
MLPLLAAWLAAGAVSAAPAAPATSVEPAADPAELKTFSAEVARQHGLPQAQVQAWLGEARYQQSIIDAITRPAEAKPWSAYRPIFLTPKRIADGRAFLAEHRAALARVAAQTGVPAEVVVAIIGVETNYGAISGNYRVLDALYTLAFHYPKRAPFFRGELQQFFPLLQEEGLDARQLKGSYAGAMGWGQFMPSSYRAYARDGDGDGRRDLFGSKPDIFASIANYFVAHGWQRGEPVAVPALRAPRAAPFVPDTLEAKFTLPELAAKGYRPRRAVGHAVPATLLTLQGEGGEEYWITFKNFYVISRYNRSPLYSLAVWQLAQAIASPDGEVARSAP